MGVEMVTCEAHSNPPPPTLSIECFIAGVTDAERGRTGELVQQTEDQLTRSVPWVPQGETYYST